MKINNIYLIFFYCIERYNTLCFIIPQISFCWGLALTWVKQEFIYLFFLFLFWFHFLISTLLCFSISSICAFCHNFICRPFLFGHNFHYLNHLFFFYFSIRKIFKHFCFDFQFLPFNYFRFTLFCFYFPICYYFTFDCIFISKHLLLHVFFIFFLNVKIFKFLFSFSRQGEASEQRVQQHFLYFEKLFKKNIKRKQRHCLCVAACFTFYSKLNERMSVK